eukprot:1335798-Alexandrium_andersonii.AAC.1
MRTVTGLPIRAARRNSSLRPLLLSGFCLLPRRTSTLRCRAFLRTRTDFWSYAFVELRVYLQLFAQTAPRALIVCLFVYCACVQRSCRYHSASSHASFYALGPGRGAGAHTGFRRCASDYPCRIR